MVSHGFASLAGALAVALAVTTAGCSPQAQAAQSGAGAQTAQASPEPSDPNNPLIGGWKLASETDNKNLPGVTCQVTDMSFTPTQVTQTAAGVPSTINVTYLASPTKVYVVTDAGLMHATDYLVLDKDTVQLDAILACTYHRVA